MTDRYHLYSGKWRRRGLPPVDPGQIPGNEPPPVPVNSLRIARATTTSIPFPVEPPPPTSRFPGDPGDGKYVLGWANGPGPGAPLAVGQSWSKNKISVYHDYSGGTNGRVNGSQLDIAINAGKIASQSIKLGGENPSSVLNGSLDADITVSINACKARAPWPIWLCYFHEPGGNFNTEASATLYRAAFRYIIAKFRAANVTNVCWMPILEAPFDFRNPSYSPGGGRGMTWRRHHPDWKGTNTGTAADWYTGADKMADVFGLDIYNPLVGGTSFQDYDNIWKSVTDAWTAGGYNPAWHAGVCIMEMGFSDIINPDPDWVAYANRILVQQPLRNIKCFTYWNNNGEVPRRYDFTPASDSDGDKLAGWHKIVDGAVVYTPPT